MSDLIERVDLVITNDPLPDSFKLLLVEMRQRIRELEAVIRWAEPPFHPGDNMTVELAVKCSELEASLRICESAAKTYFERAEKGTPWSSRNRAMASL